MSTTATPDPLYIWFRKIGATLSDEDYEEGVSALVVHDAEVAAKAKIELLNELSREALPNQSIRYIPSDDVTPSTAHVNSWLWMRAAGIRGAK